MRYEIKELGVTGILDQAIHIMRDHVGMLFGIMLVLFVPYNLVMTFLSFLIAEPMPLEATEAEMLMYSQQMMVVGLGLMLVGIVGGLLIIPLINGAVIHAVANIYLGRPVTVGAAIGRAFRMLLPLIWTTILMGLAIFVGLLLCVIPGIIAMFWFALPQHIVVVEGVSGIAALQRSKELMKGNIAKFFVLGLLIGVIHIAVGTIGSLIPQIYVQTVVVVLIQAVLALFSTAAYVVFYFSARCKHENFDLQLLAQSVGSASPDSDSENPFAERASL